MYSEMRPVSCIDTHHNVTIFVNHGMIENAKNWISRDKEHNFSMKLENSEPVSQRAFWRSYSLLADRANI